MSIFLSTEPVLLVLLLTLLICKTRHVTRCLQHLQNASHVRHSNGRPLINTLTESRFFSKKNKQTRALVQKGAEGVEKRTHLLEVSCGDHTIGVRAHYYAYDNESFEVSCTLCLMRTDNLKERTHIFFVYCELIKRELKIKPIYYNVTDWLVVMY